MPLEQAMAIASAFDKTMTNVLMHPNMAVKDIDFFTDRHKRLISKANNTPLEKVDKCVHEVIHDQVQDRPDSDAICAWDGTLTYSDLDRITSKLANHLIELGVGPEVRVPLCFDKSVRLYDNGSWPFPFKDNPADI